MAKHIIELFTRHLPSSVHRLGLVRAMISPLSVWFNSSLNFWKIKILPKPNPHALFQKLTTSSVEIKPFEIKGVKNIIKTSLENQNLNLVRDALRKSLKNDVSSIQELKKLKQQIYYSEHSETNKGIKALIETEAKLYIHYKQKGLTKQMKQQLDLTLIWINKFKLKYPQDPQMKQFKMNQISCLYEKTNILKLQKNKSEYIKVLQKLHKLELEQQESADKQRRCNRILRRICLHYFVQKDVNSMMEYYSSVQSDSERRIVRHYLSDLSH